jgi:hypothetical protein
MNNGAMTFEDRADLVLAVARVQYVNGQSTDQVVASAERLGRTLGLRAEIMPRWGELLLKAQDSASDGASDLSSRGRSHRRGHESRSFCDACG